MTSITSEQFRPEETVENNPVTSADSTTGTVTAEFKLYGDLPTKSTEEQDLAALRAYWEAIKQIAKRQNLSLSISNDRLNVSYTLI
jgi:hypothetical protein